MRSNAEWKYWGETDPFWSVAAWQGAEIGGARPWTAETFLALGESDFADILHHWRHYGIAPERCVEIGCGAGRMTSQLTKTFNQVLALDVSAAQIAKAKELLAEDATRVDFRIVEGTDIPAANGSCSAMFSSHVFQHLPSLAAVGAYLRETHRVMRKGGTICFHIPVAGAHQLFRRSRTWYRARNAYLTLKRLLGGRRFMEYHQYDAAEVLSLLGDVGFAEAELRVFPMTSNGDRHSFFLARRS